MPTISNRRGSGGSGAGNSDICTVVLRRWYVVLLACVALLVVIMTSVLNNDPSETTMLAAMTYLGAASKEGEDEHGDGMSSGKRPLRVDETVEIGTDNAARDDSNVDSDKSDALVGDDETVEIDEDNAARDDANVVSDKSDALVGNKNREHPEGLEVRRDQLIGGLKKRFGKETCKFPEFFYKNWEYIQYNLEDVGAYIEHGWRRREKKKYLSGEYEYSRDEDHDPPRSDSKTITNLKRKISYIHVGKAGGSSVSCSIREARKYGVGKHCKKSHFNEQSYNETAISQQVDCYSHYNYQGMCYGEGRSYLYNVRNPIHRIKSWYLYEHFLNQPATQKSFRNKMAHCGNIMLGTCYEDFDQLASIGLKGSRPPFHSKQSILRVATNLTADECSDWAWATITGEVPASYHNAFNYDWYFAPMLEKEYLSSEVFVLRVEHLDSDWGVVDKMVGGDGKTLAGDVMPATIGANVNVAKDKDDLLITNATLSEAGALNLCKAMCHEFQTYKMMLKRAVNLNDDDVNESIEEVREICPEETFEIREC